MKKLFQGVLGQDASENSIANNTVPDDVQNTISEGQMNAHSTADSQPEDNSSHGSGDTPAKDNLSHSSPGIVSAFNEITKPITKAVDSIRSSLAENKNLTFDETAIMNIISDLTLAVAESISVALGKLINESSTFNATSQETALTVVATALQQVVEAKINGELELANAVRNAVTSALKTGLAAVSEIADIIKSESEGIGDSAVDLVTSLAQETSSANHTHTVQETVIDITDDLNDTLESAKNLTENVVAEVGDIIGDVGKAIENTTTALVDGLNSSIETAVESAEAAAASVGSAAEAVITNPQSAQTYAHPAVIQLREDMMRLIKNRFDDLFPGYVHRN